MFFPMARERAMVTVRMRRDRPLRFLEVVYRMFFTFSHFSGAGARGHKIGLPESTAAFCVISAVFHLVLTVGTSSHFPEGSSEQRIVKGCKG